MESFIINRTLPWRGMGKSLRLFSIINSSTCLYHSLISSYASNRQKQTSAPADPPNCSDEYIADAVKMRLMSNPLKTIAIVPHTTYYPSWRRQTGGLIIGCYS